MLAALKNIRLDTAWMHLMLLLGILCISGDRSGARAPITGIVVKDFGEIAAGESPQLSHIFVLANNLPHSLNVTQVVASCGCILVDVPKVHVNPGEEVRLPVRVETSGINGGYFEKVIVVTFNSMEATHELHKRLVLRGKVQESSAVELTPRSIDFGVVDDTTIAREVSAISIGGSSLADIRAEPDTPGFTATVKCHSGANRCRVVVRADPSGMPLGNIKAAVAIVSGTGRVLAKVPIRALRQSVKSPRLRESVMVRVPSGGYRDCVLGKISNDAVRVQDVTFSGEAYIGLRVFPLGERGDIVVRVYAPDGICDSPTCVISGNILATLSSGDSVLVPAVFTVYR